MALTEVEIKNDIFFHIINRGGVYKEWYVGVASDPIKQLFMKHRIDEKNDFWIYRKAESSEAAARVNDYFLNRLGTDGYIDKKDDNCIYIYAFKKNNHKK